MSNKRYVMGMMGMVKNKDFKENKRMIVSRGQKVLRHMLWKSSFRKIDSADMKYFYEGYALGDKHVDTEKRYKILGTENKLIHAMAGLNYPAKWKKRFRRRFKKEKQTN